MNFMKNPTTIIEWSNGQKFTAEFLGTGTIKTNKETRSIPATARQVSMTIPVQLTPEGARAYRELMFFGKHLKPAPPHIEYLLLQREAWATVYHTCHGKVDEVLNCYLTGEATESTTTEALSWLTRVMAQACDRMEHYDLCYSLELTVDENYH